jgi:putative phosphoribosyl transferase
MFRNRQHAGFLLARQVWRMANQDRPFDASQSMVVGLPRGGVTVALEIALALGCPLDVLVSKKIGAPDQPELAVGAVTSDGIVLVNEELIAVLGIKNSYIESQKAFLIGKTKILEEHWLESAGIKERPSMQNKQVIIVDDGIATGMTAIAAARSSRKRGAREIIITTPVMSSNAYALLQKECDQIVALNVLFDFAAIGQFYLDFEQVDDQEVVKALKQAKEERMRKQDVAIS